MPKPKVKPNTDEQNMPNTPIYVEEADDTDSNILLSNTDRYLSYIRQQIRQIIIDDDLHYSDPMDKKRIYPAFTYLQFQYILGRLYDRVYSVRYDLLCKDGYTPKFVSPNNINNIHKLYDYDTVKVKKAYDVYLKLCQYYGYIPSVEPFYSMTGIEDSVFKEWLSAGRTDLLNFMIKNAKNATITGFDNSHVPLLKLASANYRYRLNTESAEDKEHDMIADNLPDLLALPSAKKPEEEP